MVKVIRSQDASLTVCEIDTFRGCITDWELKWYFLRLRHWSSELRSKWYAVRVRHWQIVTVIHSEGASSRSNIDRVWKLCTLRMRPVVQKLTDSDSCTLWECVQSFKNWLIVTAAHSENASSRSKIDRLWQLHTLRMCPVVQNWTDCYRKHPDGVSFKTWQRVGNYTLSYCYSNTLWGCILKKKKSRLLKRYILKCFIQLLTYFWCKTLKMHHLNTNS